MLRIRRNVAEFDDNIRTYLDSSGPITQVEETSKNGGGGQSAGRTAPGAGGSLGIGSLKGV
jgi:hypothetical protein